MKTNIALYKVSSILIFAVVISGATLVYSKAEGNQIQVCVKKSGLIYVIGDEFRRSDCKKNDSFLSWNTVGIQGPKGEKGDKGSTLRLTDDANHDLGRFLNLETDGWDRYELNGAQTLGYNAYIESLGLFVRYNLLGGGAIHNPSWLGEDNNYVLFSEPNCSSGYVSRYKSGFIISLAGNYGQNGFPPYSNVHIRQIKNGATVVAQVRSRYTDQVSGNNVCENVTDGETREFGGEVISFPITGEIRIVER